jgi:hypothetical protein
MASRKPPVWEWEGKTECPECGETARFFREEGWEALTVLLNDANWVVQLFHSHTGPVPEGEWHVAVYKSFKGRQKPEIVKDAKGQHSEQFKKKQTARQIENAGS